MKDDPKLRALLIRREQGRKPPERLWQSGDVAPLSGILAINHMHSNGEITFKEWLRYTRERANNMIEHYGTAADREALHKVPRLEEDGAG